LPRGRAHPLRAAADRRTDTVFATDAKDRPVGMLVQSGNGLRDGQQELLARLDGKRPA
jgi:hypothetical protein